MRSSEIVQVDPKSKDGCPSERHKKERRMERSRRPQEDGGRDWNDVATAKECLRPPEERKKDSPLGPSEGALVPAQSCERTHFCCWKPPKTVVICYSTPGKFTHLTSFSWTDDILMIRETESYDYQTHKFEISQISFTLQLVIVPRLIN